MHWRSHILSRYPPFSWLPSAVAIRWAAGINTLIAVAAGVLFIIGAWRDGTFKLEHGVGLFEHPGIWIYLIGQPLLPMLLDRALLTFAKIPHDQRALFTSTFIATDFRADRQGLYGRLSRRTVLFGLIYKTLVFAGLVAWVLNTLKNQIPLQSYGFDVWDAWPHYWGYWSTRVYKLYVAAMLAPAIVHAQIAIVISITQLVISAGRTGGLRLDPYAADEAGGTRRLIDTVLNPLVSVVLAASLMSVAAIYVHGRFDSTTVGGLAITISVFCLVYVVPAAALRFAIVADKRRQRSVLRERQAELYATLRDPDVSAAQGREAIGMIQDLTVLVERIDKLPVWPQLTRVAATISAAVTSPVLAFALNKNAQITGLLNLFR